MVILTEQAIWDDGNLSQWTTKNSAVTDTRWWTGSATISKTSGSIPVLPDMQPGDLVDRLPAHAPDLGEPMDAILEDFQRSIVPALTHWNHPRFFAYFSISASHPGILAEMLAAALNVNGMLWKSCPALTELEQVTLGMAAPMDGTARGILRHHLRHRLHQHAARHRGGARDGRSGIAHARQRARPGDVHLRAGALVGGKGRHHARNRPG